MTPSPFAFDNSYTTLPSRLYSRVDPNPVRAPKLIRINKELAETLDIDNEWLASPDGISVLAGNTFPDNAARIATAYAGHQFGHFNPNLGDGRALLLGEIVGRDKQRYDIQLKGSGPTPYSRSGDGRSPLGPVLREYIVSEAMHVLGIPTSRSLAAVTTGEDVYRQNTLPGGILTRIAHSHIRIGTFEYVAAQKDFESLGQLTSYALARHYPGADQEGDRALTLLKCVAANQAELIAKWMLVGFIHGVMNTDNMLISGETIDYGPCAFMDDFNPQKVFSSIDRRGRYAFENQPKIGAWNLTCLAQALLPVMQTDQSMQHAQDTIDKFESTFRGIYRDGLRAKCGLSIEHEGDDALINELLRTMQTCQADFTLTFRALCDLVNDSDYSLQSVFSWPKDLNPWLNTWKARLQKEKSSIDEIATMMRRINPAIIPRNHLIEEAIQKATFENDFDAFHSLVDALTNPYAWSNEFEKMARAPKPEQLVTQTFCGT